MKNLPLSMGLILLCLQLSACVSTPIATTSITNDMTECHPNIDSQQQQFTIGYGSLMQEASRLRTAPNAKDITPIHLTGFQRGWFSKGSEVGFSTTYLGAIIDNHGEFNAVSFEVNETDIKALDQRESGYCRSLVAKDQITTLLSTPLPKGQYWIYTNTPNSIAMASTKNPIVQSYVDIFISGCMEQEQRFQLSDFALQCINSSTEWSAHWVNDRIYPRRPFIHQPLAGKIDQLLNQTLPKLFNNISIE